MIAINNSFTALNAERVGFQIRAEYSNAYQNEKSYLWQAIALLSRIHNEDAFNCHQNGYKVTESGTINLYQNSKLFTKTVKAGYEFLNDIKRAWLIIGVPKKVGLVFRHVRGLA